MFATIAHRYDAANRILSCCFDVSWRRMVARRLLPAPGRVLDLAAGTGDLSIDLARNGGHRVISADFTFEMLLAGLDKLARSRVEVRQVAADALALPFASGLFDGVTVAFGIRNFADPLAGLREIARVTRQGGAVGVLEFSRPARLLERVFRWYFHHLLPRIGGLITGSRTAYEYLPLSVEEFPEGDAFLSLMKDAGLKGLTAARLSGGIVTFYRGEKE